MFVVRCTALLLQILRCAQKDREREFRMTFLVTIDEDCYNVILNGAVGEVKDLEYHIGSLSRAAVSDGLRNRFPWGRDSLPGLNTIPAFLSIVFPAKLCLSLISHTGFCRWIRDPI